MKRTFFIDTFVILVCAALLIWPLFRLKYLDNWPSIESTFIADSRMLENNLPHPGWQPLWYCGTRFDYVYPPALRYGPALIAKLARMTTARAYHLYTAILYVLGIAAVYWLVRIGSGTRWAGLLASAATALLSPSFLLLSITRHDSAHLVPQRLHVLMQYGEGPHISALCLLPAAMAASFLAIRSWRPIAVILAGVLCALVAAHNFYGANSLAIFFAAMTWAVWVGERKWLVWARAAGIGALAYGLSAFWLTPSYVRITLTNLHWVSQPGKTSSIVIAAVVIALFCVLSFFLAKNRPDLEWATFVVGAALVLSLEVLGFFYFGLVMTGVPERHIPELDLALILLLVEVTRRLWRRKQWRIAVAVALVVAFAPARHYLRHAWSPFPKAGDFHAQYEYRIAQWVHEHLPGERVFPTGSVRFWFDAWFDNAQPDGGSVQGMENQIIPAATWQILYESRADLALLWLQALGTDAVIAVDRSSREHYHDYRQPYKFQGVSPVLFDDRQGTVIYRVPRVHPGIGRLVDRAAIGSVGKIRGGDDAVTLTKYAGVIEDESKPLAEVHWNGFDEASIGASVRNGESILVQETYDSSWHAYENGKPLPIRMEPVMGFMLIDLPEGPHHIQMMFETPLENRVGQGLSVVSLALILSIMAGKFMGKRRNTGRTLDEVLDRS